MAHGVQVALLIAESVKAAVKTAGGWALSRRRGAFVPIASDGFSAAPGP